MKKGWAEQDPEMWWDNLKLAHRSAMQKANIKGEEVIAIGITSQMHSLVVVDKDKRVLCPSIIWCDSRAVSYGKQAFGDIGENKCLSTLLNSPGNFTASKLAWIKENDPAIFLRINKFMLPCDYIAMRLSGEIGMTIEGLSECILWNFRDKCVSKDVLDYFGIPESIVPPIKPTFGIQGEVSPLTANELGLKAGTPISYRAGDQPNNALSLKVFNPGEIASTAGTSGVVYGVSDKLEYDKLSRVNTFAHVNYTDTLQRLGVLLCINSTGILNSWLKRNLSVEGLSYAEMNDLAMQSDIGAKNLFIVPFGNGAERMLENRIVDCSIHGINFNVHDKRDIVRAAQEAIAFSFQYGIEVMKGIGLNVSLIRAGYANMFLSPLFAEVLANVSGAEIELYDTDGAAGAAKAAGMGINYYASEREAFGSLKKIQHVEPQLSVSDQYQEIYDQWKTFFLR